MPYSPTPAALQGRTEFGARLRQVRIDRGLTQEELAHRAGMDRSFFVEVEGGKHSLMLDRVFDLADALDVSIAELFNAG